MQGVGCSVEELGLGHTAEGRAFKGWGGRGHGPHLVWRDHLRTVLAEWEGVGER